MMHLPAKRTFVLVAILCVSSLALAQDAAFRRCSRTEPHGGCRRVAWCAASGAFAGCCPSGESWDGSSCACATGTARVGGHCCAAGESWSVARADSFGASSALRGHCCPQGTSWTIRPAFHDDTGMHGSDSGGCCPAGRVWYGSRCEVPHTECPGDAINCVEHPIGEGGSIESPVDAFFGPSRHRRINARAFADIRLTTERGGVSVAALKRAAGNALLGRVKMCVAGVISRSPRLSGRIVLQAEINGSGWIATDTPETALEGGLELVPCLISGVRGFRAPAGAASTRARLEISVAVRGASVGQ